MDYTNDSEKPSNINIYKQFCYEHRLTRLYKIHRSKGTQEQSREFIKERFLDKKKENTLSTKKKVRFKKKRKKTRS